MVLCNLMQPAFSVFRIFVSVLSHLFDGTISKFVPLDYSVCGSSALVAWDGIDDLTRYEAAFFLPPQFEVCLTARVNLPSVCWEIHRDGM